MFALAIIVSLIASNLALTEQQSKLLKRIVNGQPSELFSRPYQASLQIFYQGSWQHFCGASIIDVDRLVTAAHCLIFPPEISRIQVGQLNLTAPPSEFKQTLEVKAIKAHEDYDNNVFLGFPNDIGLIYTKTPIRFNANVQPVKIAPGGQTFDNTNCIISGYGKTSGSGGSSPVLMEVAMPKITFEECKAIYGQIGLSLSDNAICVFDGDNPPGKNPSSCAGDSGGPMLCRHESREYLAGLASFGLSTCEGWLPSAYTRVAAYKSWISKNKHAPEAQ